MIYNSLSMIIDHDTQTISFRQSWLDTYFTCPERGRLAVVAPEYDEQESDEAIIGTCMHWAAEQKINGSLEPIGQLAIQYAYDYCAPLVENDMLKWSKRSTVEEIAAMAAICAEAWERDIQPQVHLIDSPQTELGFKVNVSEHRGWKININGTIDLVGAEVADWKSTGQDYKPHEKQRWAIQPTIYAMALTSGELDTAHEYTYPLNFVYGVVTKPSSLNGKGKGKLVRVVRNAGHARWAIHRMKTAINMFLDHGLDNEWPQIEAHYLCSSLWCPWWITCKGMHLSSLDNEKPPQDVAVLAPKRSLALTSS